MLWWLTSNVPAGRKPGCAWVSLTPDLNPPHQHPRGVQNVAAGFRPGTIQHILQPRASSIPHRFSTDVNLAKPTSLGRFGSLLGGRLLPKSQQLVLCLRFCTDFCALMDPESLHECHLTQNCAFEIMTSRPGLCKAWLI